MSRTTLRPVDIPEGALLEVRVDEHGAFCARFYWAENTAHHGYDGEGTGETLDAAALAAVRDADEE